MYKIVKVKKPPSWVPHTLSFHWSVFCLFVCSPIIVSDHLLAFKISSPMICYSIFLKRIPPLFHLLHHLLPGLLPEQPAQLLPSLPPTNQNEGSSCPDQVFFPQLLIPTQTCQAVTEQLQARANCHLRDQLLLIQY